MILAFVPFIADLVPFTGILYNATTQVSCDWRCRRKSVSLRVFQTRVMRGEILTEVTWDTSWNRAMRRGTLVAIIT